MHGMLQRSGGLSATGSRSGSHNTAGSRVLHREGAIFPPLEAQTSMESVSATILIVEDDQPTRMFLADNLAADGYDLLEAECAFDAHRQMETGFPDLAIVDLGLPDGDGLELLRLVREADRVAAKLDPDLPMLVLTGRAGELDRLRGVRSRR